MEELFDGEYNARLTDKNPEYKFQGMYRGYVVDDEDPRDIGRVKIRIPGVYRKEVDNEDIPWAIPASGLTRSGGNNMKPERSTDLTEKELTTAFNKTGTGGFFTIPSRGSHVWVFFDQGHHMHPVYFACATHEDDWLVQKQYLKDKINSKIDQIVAFRNKFTPEDGTKGFSGVNWADGSHVNARQDITGGGDKAPYKKDAGIIKDNSTSGITELKTDANYEARVLNINNKDVQGKKSLNMDVATNREWANYPTMDIKPLFDNEEEKINREKYPHKYPKDFKIDAPKETGRNINRFITSMTSQGGTTIAFDSREEQENYYLIHKNYIENLDQDGSRKVFIGQNDPEIPYVRDAKTNDDRNRGPEGSVRSNDELAVAGDKKTHVLGNTISYTKGNVFTQIDKNMQVDINDSCGFRIKKGDFDIVIEGDDEENTRDGGSKRESGKSKDDQSTQYGDLNIAIKNGHLEVYVKENVNIHVEGQANIMVDGEMRTHVKQSAHLYVEGDYCEYIKGNKYVTVEQNVEQRYNYDTKGHVKTEIFGNEYKDVHKNKHLNVGTSGNGSRYTWIRNNEHLIVDTGKRISSIKQLDDIKIGSSTTKQVGTSEDIKIGSTYKKEIGSSFDLKVGSTMKTQCSSTFDLKAGNSMNYQAGGTVYINCPSDLKVVGNANISNNLKVGSAGSFGSKVYAPDFGSFSLSLVNHMHVQGNGSHFGGGGITSKGFGGAVGIKPPNTSGSVASPSTPATPSTPTKASAGINSGGGKSMASDPKPINAIFPNEQNDKKSTNHTKIARRKHFKSSTGRSRKEKPLT